MKVDIEKREADSGVFKAWDCPLHHLPTWVVLWHPKYVQPYPLGNGFRVSLRVAGIRHRFTLETMDRREAEHFARRKHAELEAAAARRISGVPDRMTLAQLLARFEAEKLPLLAAGAQHAYRDALKPIHAWFIDGPAENPTVEGLTTRQVADYLVWRRAHRVGGGAPVSARTVAKDRAVLHRIMAWAAGELGLRDGNPVSRTEPPKGDGREPVILTDAELERLLDAARDHPMLWLYILVLAETGARCESEALWLRWEDVDLEGGFLQIASGRGGHRTKSGRSRWTPMTQRLTVALREHFARFRLAVYDKQRSPWVFHHTISRRHHRAGARIASLYDGFKAAARRARLTQALRQHDLRHRRVTTWLAAGANPVHVKEAVGHSDLRTTMGYTHLVREHLKSLVQLGSVPAGQRSA